MARAFCPLRVIHMECLNFRDPNTLHTRGLLEISGPLSVVLYRVPVFYSLGSHTWNVFFFLILELSPSLSVDLYRVSVF